MARSDGGAPGESLRSAHAALLPAATRARWCEEWLGELHTLPARRDRVRFAIHTMLGIPRLAVTVRGTDGTRIGGATLMLTDAEKDAT